MQLMPLMTNGTNIYADANSVSSSLQNRLRQLHLVVLIVLVFSIVVQRDLIQNRPRAGPREGATDPLRLHAEEDPHPAAEHLEELDEENGHLEARQAVQVR